MPPDHRPAPERRDLTVDALMAVRASVVLSCSLSTCFAFGLTGPGWVIQ